MISIASISSMDEGFLGTILYNKASHINIGDGLWYQGETRRVIDRIWDLDRNTFQIIIERNNKWDSTYI